VVQGRLELTKFQNPVATTAEPNAPANTLGLRRLMFAVDDIDDVVGRLRARGFELVGEVARYEDSYWPLCSFRGRGKGGVYAGAGFSPGRWDG
jgi:hypothetical protein